MTITDKELNELERVLDIHYKFKRDYQRANDNREYELEAAYYEGLCDALYILTNGKVSIDREDGEHHIVF